MRMSIAALLGGVLISVVFAAGCAGNEEKTNEETTEDQTRQQSPQQGKETMEERTGARAKDAGGRARPGEAMLEMSGDPGTEFSGSCTVGDETSEIDGQVPDSYTYELDGERLDCEIRKESADGNLQIAFTAGPNTRSVQQISGGTLNLTYENGHLSSVSSSSSGSGGQVSSSQVVSSSQGNSSSINISR